MSDNEKKYPNKNIKKNILIIFVFDLIGYFLYLNEDFKKKIK